MFGRCVVAASVVVRQKAAAEQQTIRRASFIRVRSLRDMQRLTPPENKFRLTCSQNEVRPARNGCKSQSKRGLVAAGRLFHVLNPSGENERRRTCPVATPCVVMDEFQPDCHSTP